MIGWSRASVAAVMIAVVLATSAQARAATNPKAEQAAISQARTALAAKAGDIRRMGLIHYSPRYTNRELKILRDECREHFPGAFLCRDRMVIPLPHREEDED